MTARRFLLALGVFAVALFASMAFTPLPQLVDGLLSVEAQTGPADAIVVLGGGGVRGNGTLTDVSLRRTLMGITLYRRALAPLLVLSGPPAGSRAAEAVVRWRVALALGVPEPAILMETRARTTWAEAQALAGLLRPRAVRRILLVADAQGMRRAKGVFSAAGFLVLPAPADDVSSFGGSPEDRLGLTRRLLIELSGLAYYRLAGYL